MCRNVVRFGSEGLSVPVFSFSQFVQSYVSLSCKSTMRIQSRVKLPEVKSLRVSMTVRAAFQSDKSHQPAKDCRWNLDYIVKSSTFIIQMDSCALFFFSNKINEQKHNPGSQKIHFQTLWCFSFLAHVWHCTNVKTAALLIWRLFTIKILSHLMCFTAEKLSDQIGRGHLETAKSYWLQKKNQKKL